MSAFSGVNICIFILTSDPPIHHIVQIIFRIYTPFQNFIENFGNWPQSLKFTVVSPIFVGRSMPYIDNKRLITDECDAPEYTRHAAISNMRQLGLSYTVGASFRRLLRNAETKVLGSLALWRRRKGSSQSPRATYGKCRDRRWLRIRTSFGMHGTYRVDERKLSTRLENRNGESLNLVQMKDYFRIMEVEETYYEKVRST